MAVVVQQKFTGSTLDQYDEAIAKLGITAGGPHTTPGLLFHYVVATDEGVEIRARRGIDRVIMPLRSCSSSRRATCAA